MASEFIDLLRPATIIGRVSGFRVVPFNVRLARQTLAGTANWVGEGASKPVTKQGFDAMTIPHTKIACIVAITEELARFSDPSAELLIRNDLIQVIGSFMDEQFIDPTVTATNGVKPASITNGITPIASTGSTVAEVTADLAAALSAMATSNVPMTAPVWIMHPRTSTFLSLLRGVNDQWAFPEMQGGRLLGYPVVTSTSVPVGSSPDFETTITLMDAGGVLLADDGQVTIDVSREASLQMDDAPATPATPLVSLWQQNLIGIRAERYVYWTRRHAESVQVISGVQY
jgi:HK97 family phage major capsid protein